MTVSSRPVDRLDPRRARPARARAPSPRAPARARRRRRPDPACGRRASAPTTRCGPTETGRRRTCTAFASANAQKRAERDRDREDERHRRVVRRRRIVEQHQHPDGERDQAGERERAVRDRRARRSRASATPSRISPSPAHEIGQHREAEERGERARRRRARPGSTTPGWKISKPMPGDAGEEEQAEMFGSMSVFRRRVKKPGFDRVDLRAREVQRERPLRILRLVAVELVEQRGQGRRDQVDHVHLQRLLRGQVRRLAHGDRRPGRVSLCVAASAVRDAAASLITFRRRSVPRFCAARVDRRRRADVRRRRHREHVGRLRDPDAGRRGARAVGRDVDDHRQLRVRARPCRSSSSRSRGRRACRAGSRPRRSRPSPRGRAALVR